MDQKRFLEIEALLVDQNITIFEAVGQGLVSETEAREWIERSHWDR